MPAAPLWAMSIPKYFHRGIPTLRPIWSIPKLFRLSARWIEPTTFRRPIHLTQKIRKNEKKSDDGVSAEDLSRRGGNLARTDSNVRVEYPQVGELPASPAVQGRGGRHFKRTLASFSLEGRVGVVTGGARGLGLVMSQALITSGASIAIVDLNSTSNLLVI